MSRLPPAPKRNPNPVCRPSLTQTKDLCILCKSSPTSSLLRLIEEQILIPDVFDRSTDTSTLCLTPSTCLESCPSLAQYLLFSGSTFCSSWEHYSSARNISGPHSGKPNIKEPDLGINGGGRNASSKTALAAPSQHDQPDSEEIKLVLDSLPDRGAVSPTEIGALIAQEGSWERALEILLDQQTNPQQPSTPSSSSQPSSPPSMPPAPSGSSSPLQTTASASQYSETPSRPTTPTKRSLSKSFQQATLRSTPATRRRRLLDPSDAAADSSSSELSEVEHSLVAQHLAPRPESPLTDVVSDFDDEPAISASRPRPASSERRATRSATAHTRAAMDREKLKKKQLQLQPTRSYATRSKSSTPQIVETPPTSDPVMPPLTANDGSVHDSKPLTGKAKREAAKQRRHLAK